MLLQVFIKKLEFLEVLEAFLHFDKIAMFLDELYEHLAGTIRTCLGAFTRAYISDSGF